MTPRGAAATADHLRAPTSAAHNLDTSSRQRPYAQFSGQDASLAGDPEQSLGFVSGHTSLAFSATVSLATVASLRRHRLTPWIWATAVPLAGLGGYMRVAADRHYMSDVLAGAALGTAVGVAVPLLVHSSGPRWARARRRANLTIVPSPRGLTISGSF